MDTVRQRFLTDRVLTATPAQRVAMLYDRLALDLRRAAEDPAAGGPHVDHALAIVAELFGSLDRTAGGPAAHLDSLYGWMLRELTAWTPAADLTALAANVDVLRSAWWTVADGTDHAAAHPAPQPVPLSTPAVPVATGAPVASLSWTA